MPIPLPILRLFAAHDLPFAGALLRHAGVWAQPAWRDAPTRTCRGRWSGCRMTLDLRDFHQRGAYFYGRLLDLPVQLTMREALRPGDMFIDIGANIGVLTLQGARAVGPRGIVHAFEPNPDVFARLEAHIAGNHLKNVVLHRVALSDREGTLTLSIPPTGNTGAGSLGGLAPRHFGAAVSTYEVALKRGDDVLTATETGSSSPGSPVLIKIDVEGHEPFALRGMERFIAARRPAILAEINQEMLACNGSSAPGLLQLIEDWDYEPWVPGASWSRLRRRWSLRLHPTRRAWRPARTLNALFLPRDGGTHRARLARFMVSSPAGPAPRASG